MSTPAWRPRVPAHHTVIHPMPRHASQHYLTSLSTRTRQTNAGACEARRRKHAHLLIALVVCLAACSGQQGRIAPASRESAAALLPGPKPTAPTPRDDIVGEYDCDARVCLLIEDEGQLFLLDTATSSPRRIALAPAGGGASRNAPPSGAATLSLAPDSTGRLWPSNVRGIALRHRNVGPQPGSTQLQVTPVRPLPELRTEALAASPPVEPPPARSAELVELTRLDPAIKLEIRYATTNNFLGTQFYDEARAFMQRPAAEAVARANQKLRSVGYGLLIHDAYRPWYVTKMFWDATPLDKRWLVANPASGSKHNRGAAVDLTLFDLATGKPVDMPSTYDESTGRAFADYPGGTSLQRWHRALLRNAMVSEGFLVNPSEWWHFDYASWRDYALGNVSFDKIAK